MAEISMEDLDEASSDDGRSEDERDAFYEAVADDLGIDYDELRERNIDAARLNVRPECAIGFSQITDVGFTGDVNDRQNIRGENEHGQPGGSLAITVYEPYVIGGTLYQSVDETQSSDYKLVGGETTQEWTRNDTVMGVKYDGRTFDAEPVEAFEDDFVTIYLNGALGQYVGQSLDAYGAAFEDSEDSRYDAPVGLVEYAPDDSGDEPRFIRGPYLRTDMWGIDGAIKVSLGSGGEAFVGNAFRSNGELTELVPITDTDHEGYTEAHADAYVGDVYWGDADTSTDDADGAGSSESPEEDTSVDDEVMDMDFGTTEESSGSLYDDLDTYQQSFVDNVVAHLENNDMTTDDVDVGTLFENKVEEIDELTWGSTSENELETIVSTRMGE